MKRGTAIAWAVIVSLLALGVLVVMIGVVTDEGLGFLRSGFFRGGFFGAAEAREVVERTVGVRERPVVRVFNELGRVTVRTSDQDLDEVRVVATKIAYGANRDRAKEELERIEVSIEQSQNGVVIEGRVPDKVGVGNSDRVEMVIEVPENSEVDVEAQLGKIDVSGLSGTLSVDAKLGEIDVNRFSGNLELQSEMGEVNVVGAQIRDTMKITAAMGEVVFQGRPGRDNRIEASMGSVRVGIPDDVSMEWAVDVGMGDVKTDFPVSGEVSQRGIRGIIGRGIPEGKFEIRASLGSVKIERQR